MATSILSTSAARRTKAFPLSYAQWKAAATVILYVILALALPGLCHLLPSGGARWLPVCFLTLIVAWRYGLRVGLVAAVGIPVVHALLFGMPTAAALPLLVVKAAVVAVAASLVSRHVAEATLAAVALAVVASQIVGGLAAWLIVGTWHAAVADVTTGWPGLLAQVVGGWLLLRYVIRR